MNWSQNDEFVTFYRNKGDFHKNPPDIPALHKAVDYHNCRIYYHPQIVVDAVYYPKLATVCLEDL